MFEKEKVFEQEVKAGFVKVEHAVEAAASGIETWYQEHFHSSATQGTPALSKQDKAALLQHVQASVASLANPPADKAAADSSHPAQE